MFLHAMLAATARATSGDAEHGEYISLGAEAEVAPPPNSAAWNCLRQNGKKITAAWSVCSAIAITGHSLPHHTYRGDGFDDGMVGAPVQVEMENGSATPMSMMGQQPSMFAQDNLKNFDVWYPYLQQVSGLCHEVSDTTLRQRCAARVAMLQSDIYSQPGYACSNDGDGQKDTGRGPTQPFNYPFNADGARQKRECNALYNQYNEETGCCCNCFAYYSANARGRRLLEANESCVCCGFLWGRCAVVSILSAFPGGLLCVPVAAAIDAHDAKKRENMANRG